MLTEIEYDFCNKVGYFAHSKYLRRSLSLLALFALVGSSNYQLTHAKECQNFMQAFLTLLCLVYLQPKLSLLL